MVSKSSDLIEISECETIQQNANKDLIHQSADSESIKFLLRVSSTENIPKNKQPTTTLASQFDRKKSKTSIEEGQKQKTSGTTMHIKEYQNMNKDL